MVARDLLWRDGLEDRIDNSVIERIICGMRRCLVCATLVMAATASGWAPPQVAARLAWGGIDVVIYPDSTHGTLLWIEDTQFEPHRVEKGHRRNCSGDVRGHGAGTGGRQQRPERPKRCV